MFSKFTLAAAAGAVAITAMPAAASAQYRGGYDDYRSGKICGHQRLIIRPTLRAATAG